MSGFSHWMRFGLPALVLGGLAGTISSSLAQEPYGAQVYPSPSEQIYVYGPRHVPEYGYSGAPVENISISRPVRFDDLDLRTPWGANALRWRILYATDELCRQMNQFYPTTVYPQHGDSFDCNRRALRDAMYQADIAIARARSYAD